MARISIEELYRGEGGGAKYGVGGIMGAVMQEIMTYGVPKEYDEQTQIELLIVKHTLKAAGQMKIEGDFVSGMTDTEPPSCYPLAMRRYKMKILEELWYGNVTPGERGMEKDGRLWNLGRLILQNEEELAPLLSEKAKEVMEKLRDNQSELNDLNECEVFVCGFRLGARIMLEVLDGNDKWGEFEE